MGFLEQIPNVVEPTERAVISFGGYSNNPVISSGEMRDMLNLTSDQYPYLSQRQPRGLYAKHGPVAYVDGESPVYSIENRNDITNIMAWKEKLAIVAGHELIYDDTIMATLSEAGDKILVGIKDMLCVFPDKICVDTSVKPAVVKNLYADTGTLLAQSITLWTNAIRFQTAMATDLFKEGDAIDIKFTPNNTSTDISVSVVVKGYEGGILLKLPENTYNEANTGYSDLVEWGDNVSGKSITAEIKASRNVPDMDYVVEYQNRLWGCKGSDIYSSKLGDPTNWFYYTSGEMENAADSYSVAVGTDGDFTGIAAFPSHLVFFKESFIHRLYGQNKPSTYQLYTLECNGMEKGSFKSAVTVDGVLYYKSPLGIMAYSGDYPVHITASFRQKYKNACAGTDKSKYWISMQNDVSDEWELFCYDFVRKMWHKEDNTHALQFTTLDGRVMYINKTDTDTEIRYISAAADDKVPKEDERIPWMALFGEFDEVYEFKGSSQIQKKKVYSKMFLRFTMEPNSEIIVKIKTDDSNWEIVSSLNTQTERSVYLPILPRRCDKFSIMLEGKGRTRIESLVRAVRPGSAV